MRDGAQAAQDLLQDFGRQHQRVTPGEEHVTYLRRAFEILDLHLKFLTREGLAWVTYNTSPRTITTIGGALRGYQHQDSVWIAVDKPGHGRVAILSKRVFHHGSKGLDFLREWNNLLAGWVIRVIRIDQRYKIRCDIHTEETLGLKCFSLRVCQREDLFDLFN